LCANNFRKGGGLSEIRPALTAEQWAAPKVFFREKRGGDEGYGVEIEAGGSMWVWDDSWAVTVDAENRHALAALALYKRPFGFTREDVRAIEDGISGIGYKCSEFHVTSDNCGCASEEARLRSLADRISALLPPEP
jgi:hypothetical protein